MSSTQEIAVAGSEKKISFSEKWFWKMLIVPLLFWFAEQYNALHPNIHKKANGRFAFIAHYVETWNRALKGHGSEYLHQNPDMAYKMPIWQKWWCKFMSFVDLFAPWMIDDDVDTYDVKPPNSEILMQGHTLLIRNFGWHFALTGLPVIGSVVTALIRLRVLWAIIFAQEVLCCKTVGLGALTKDVQIAEGGKWYQRVLGSALRATLVHGDTVTCGSLMAGVRKALADGLIPRVGKVVVVGPTSKTGAPLVRWLIEQGGFTVIIVTEDPQRAKTMIIDRLNNENEKARLIVVKSLNDDKCKGADLVITLKAKPYGDGMVDALNKLNTTNNMLVMNGAVPDPCTRGALEKATFRHVDAALAYFETGCVEMRFMMRLKQAQDGRHAWMYTCWVGTALTALNKAAGQDVDHELGMVSKTQAEEWWRMAEEGLGVTIPPWTSHLKPVTWWSPPPPNQSNTPPGGIGMMGVRNSMEDMPAMRPPDR